MSAAEIEDKVAGLLAEAELELSSILDSGEGEQEMFPAAQVPIPDPNGVIGDRPCPTCEGRGSVPFEIRQSPRYESCPDCVGTGVVLTGSFDPAVATILCERCTGRGYVDKATGEVPRLLHNPQGEPPFEGMKWNDEAGEWRWP